MFGLSKYAIIGLLVTISLMGATIKYFQSQSNKYQKEAIENRMAYESSQSAMLFYANEVAARVSEINGLAKAFADIEEKTNEAKRILRKHDFKKLVEAKPALIERRINSATERLFQDFDAIFDADPPNGDPESSTTTEAISSPG